MNLQARRSPLQFVLERWPYLSSSVGAHAVLLALLYYGGSYQAELLQQEAEVASSLRATTEISTVKRLQDLQTIQQLLEKLADHVDTPPEPSPDSLAPPQTPQELVERARELSNAIDALDKQIQADELAKLTGVPGPPPVEETTAASEKAAIEPKRNDADTPWQRLDAKASAQDFAGKLDARPADGSTQSTITQEMAASEVAALESDARATLVRRQRRLQAKTNGVQVEVQKPGAGLQGAGGSPAATVEGVSSDTAVLGEIADFIGAGEQIEPTTRSTTYADQNWGFFDRGTGGIPPIDATSLVRGRGRKFGAGGEYANRVYLNSWYIIGPFPGRHEGSLFENPSYPPEKAVLLDAIYYGKDKRLLAWRYVTAQSYPLIPPDSVEDSVYYGYTEVFVDEACDLTAWIGADDDVQIYLNDHLAWEGGNLNKGAYYAAVYNSSTTHLRDYNRSEGKRVLHFNKGRNKIFFKLSNGPNVTFLSMVLTR